MRVFACLMLGLCCFASQLWAEESIAYSHLSSDGYWQVWRVSPEDGKEKQITHSKQDKREPSWTADDKIIYRTANGKVFISSLDESSVTEILAKYQRVNSPQLSHDGRTLLFTRFDPRFKDIRDVWKSDLNGENAVILTRDNKRALQPSFSVDGKSIVFVNADTNRVDHHVWVMDADGNNARQLTTGKGQDLFPKFSPDGATVTFTSNRDGNFEIYILDLKNKKIRRLTESDGNDSNSCFSPDGEKIAFVSGRGGSQQVWIMDRDGKNARQLTHEPGESLEPQWANLKGNGK